MPKLHDLPEECIREILLRISDHRDLDVSYNYLYFITDFKKAGGSQFDFFFVISELWAG